MALTKAQIASRVMRDAQIPETADTPNAQALSDIKQYIDERARKIWEMRLWPEYIILGTYTLTASTQRIALSSITAASGFNTSGNGYNASFEAVVAIREGSNPLTAEDPGSINASKADAWADTTSPVKFVPRGQQGLFLLGQWSASKDLSFFGKAGFQTLSDSETWILNGENALIVGAQSDFARHAKRQSKKADELEQLFQVEVGKMIHLREVQSANIKRVIPINPWTSYGYTQCINTSPTGAASPYY